MNIKYEGGLSIRVVTSLNMGVTIPIWVKLDAFAGKVCLLNPAKYIRCRCKPDVRRLAKKHSMQLHF